MFFFLSNLGICLVLFAQMSVLLWPTHDFQPYHWDLWAGTHHTVTMLSPQAVAHLYSSLVHPWPTEPSSSGSTATWSQPSAEPAGATAQLTESGGGVGSERTPAPFPAPRLFWWATKLVGRLARGGCSWTGWAVVGGEQSFSFPLLVLLGFISLSLWFVRGFFFSYQFFFGSYYYLFLTIKLFWSFSLTLPVLPPSLQGGGQPLSSCAVLTLLKQMHSK